MTETCYVCDKTQHEASDHTFMSWVDAEAWFDRQPDASSAAQNRASIHAEAGLPLGGEA